MVDVFSTQVLNRVVENMPDFTSFLTDMFFPSVDVQESDVILFDTTNGRKLITPYVSPLAEAPYVNEMGYETDSFRPAYLKDKRLFNPNRGVARLPGEKIGGELTPQQRVDRAIKANLAEQIDMIGHRMEQMAGEVLKTGKITVSGENYPAVTVDFRRRSENTIVLTGGDRWGQVGAKSPYDTVEDEAQELNDATGFHPVNVIMGPGAWKLYKADLLANHKDDFNTLLTNLTLGEVAMSYVLQPRDGVSYRGRVGYLHFWVYTGTYTDPEDGVTKSTLGDMEVLICASSVEGVRHYGRIKDFDANLGARQYFVKSKVKFDPSGVEFLMQSAPLLVPYRRNNVKRILVG